MRGEWWWWIAAAGALWWWLHERSRHDRDDMRKHGVYLVRR